MCLQSSKQLVLLLGVLVCSGRLLVRGVLVLVLGMLLLRTFLVGLVLLCG